MVDSSGGKAPKLMALLTTRQQAHWLLCIITRGMTPLALSSGTMSQQSPIVRRDAHLLCLDIPKVHLHPPSIGRSSDNANGLMHFLSSLAFHSQCLIDARSAEIIAIF